MSTHLQVIKVESMRQADSARGLGPSPARGMGSMFLGSGRSKQSVMLNLAPGEAGEAGRKVFLRLAKECDVLIQNFRPGSMERMGLDYEAVKKVNPDIIYLSSAGFGPTGPYSGTRIYDPIILKTAAVPEAPPPPPQLLNQFLLWLVSIWQRLPVVLFEFRPNL